MILHIAPRSGWETAAPSGEYRPESLETESFIHCSTAEQLLMPANAMFRGQQDLLLLCIDPAKLRARLVYEDCYQTGHAFPHIYGPLNTDAVVRVVDFPPKEDGTFDLPPQVSAFNVAPILEHDASPDAVIEPSRVLKPIDIPQHAVLCFFQDVITGLSEAGQLRQIYRLGSEIGLNFVYELELDGRRLALLHPGVGAPLSAAFLEEMIALGSRKFIACGGCGVVDGAISMGQVVVPDRAVRDEGTSYHYLPPAREVAASPTAVNAITTVLARHSIDHIVGKTWTTDGVYRETPAKVARRQAEGCITVEMEAAAFFAVAQFRRVEFGQILYGGDDVSGSEWEHRGWQKQPSTREKLFWLAAEACLEL